MNHGQRRKITATRISGNIRKHNKPATARNVCHNNITRTDCKTNADYLVSVIYNNFINTSIGQKRSNTHPDAG